MGAAVPADQAFVRRANLSLVLRHLSEHGPRSRAAVAAETGLHVMRDPEERLAEIEERLAQGDDRAAKAVTEVSRWLGFGAASRGGAGVVVERVLADPTTVDVRQAPSRL
jgi:hypothetical protein